MGAGFWHDCGELHCTCHEPDVNIRCEICLGDGVLPGNDDENFEGDLDELSDLF